MGKFYPEAMLFCVLWVALALFGLDRLGWPAGLALSIGLLVVILPASALILSRTGSLAIERGVRWAILVGAFLILLSLVDLKG
jgi:hypothetical protein